MKEMKEKKLPKVNTVLVDVDMINAASVNKELKPCPFCGGSKVLTAGTKNEISGNIIYRAWCVNDFLECGARISVCLGKEDMIEESRAEVVRRWNKRPTIY